MRRLGWNKSVSGKVQTGHPLSVEGNLRFTTTNFYNGQTRVSKGETRKTKQRAQRRKSFQFGNKKKRRAGGRFLPWDLPTEEEGIEIHKQQRH